MRFTNFNLLQGLRDNCSNYVTLDCVKTAHTLLNRTKKIMLSHRNNAVGKNKKEGRLC